TSPVWIFSRLNGSRRPSRLTTISSGSTTLSRVLKRWKQCSQRRRRCIVPPWSRESVTRDSWNPQYGHFMGRYAPDAGVRRDREERMANGEEAHALPAV